MSREIETVVDLWREYDEGIAGRPSLRHMYDSGNKDWRRGDDSERRFYRRRKKILDEVKTSPSSAGYLWLRRQE